MQRLATTTLVATAILALLVPAGMAGSNKLSNLGAKASKSEPIQKTRGKLVVITTEFGEISISLLPDKAPATVDNFLKLTKKGFYNGTTFHRVIPGFMIQGGCPNSKIAENRDAHGTGGPGYQIKAEFNDTKHVRGVVSMARSGDPDSAGSQFFIMVADASHLDGKYTAFGQVTQGMDVVDKIVAQKRDSRDNPLKPVTMQVSTGSGKDGKTKLGKEKLGSKGAGKPAASNSMSTSKRK